MSAKAGSLARARAFHRLLAEEPMRRIDLVRKGLPASSVQAAADYLAMSQKDLLTAIRIPVSTLTLRIRSRKPLSPEESDKLIRLAEAMKRAIAVFGDEAEGKAWLIEPIVSLGDRRPVDLLDTQDGFDLVIRTLGRIQFGAPA
jgi:putative toxin-antitoxin system antitoxin component (TIGR02293 family)